MSLVYYFFGTQCRCVHNYYIVHYYESEKLDPFSFEHNFGKYCPILTIISLLQTEIICPRKCT